MRKLALFALAAGAALAPAAASAQVMVQHSQGSMSHGRTSFHGGFGGFHGGMFPHRLQPGFIVPPMWFGPQFTIGNWQTYGFPAPPPRHRWVRYYDDAYLIDHDGRIRDQRYGMDWDQYGERWDMADGIPHYYGRGDFRPGPDDYAWVERNRGRFDEDEEDYADYGPDDGRGYGPPPPRFGPPMPACQPGPPACGGYAQGGYAQGGYVQGGYGYGYGVIAYPIVIETTVVSGGCGCGYEEVVEEEVEYSRPVVHRPRRVHRQIHRPRPVRPAPPPPGERG